MPPDPQTGQGLRCPFPDPCPYGAPALRASAPHSGAFGPFIVPGEG